MTNKRLCIVCGCEFEPNSPSQKICGSEECLKERKRQYAKEHADMYKESNRKHRAKPSVKKYRAEYDKQYQLEHKEQIRAFKRHWWQKKRFNNYLAKGELLKNDYWFTLSSTEKQLVLDKLGK